MSLPLYSYNPLESNSTIRLLILYPSYDFLAPLEADIVHIDRDSEDFGCYEAISYCWGELEFSYDLLCDSQTSVLRISENVDQMLRHLRREAQRKFLWVDAISLNQADPQEKAHQVQLMGEIYQEADQVHIWLGTEVEDDCVTEVFRIMKRMAVCSKQAKSYNASIRTKAAEFFSNLDSAGAGGFFEALQQLMSRPWFTRRWILQEITFAHDVTIHCGHSVIVWEWFTLGIMSLAQEYTVERHNPLLDQRTLVAASSIFELRYGVTEFHDFLWRFHAAKCSDPRDRLFALYGLAAWPLQVSPFLETSGDLQPNGPQFPPRVDYSRKWSDIYADAAKYLHTKHRAAFWAHLLAFPLLSRSHPDCPSWVPDWTQKREINRSITAFSDSVSSRDRFVNVEEGVGLALLCYLYGPITQVKYFDGAAEEPSIEYLRRAIQYLSSNKDPSVEKNHAQALCDLLHVAAEDKEFFWDGQMRRDLELLFQMVLSSEIPVRAADMSSVRHTVGSVLGQNLAFGIAQSDDGRPQSIGLAQECVPGDLVMRLPQTSVRVKDAFLIRPAAGGYRIVGSCLFNFPTRYEASTPITLV